MEQEHYLVFDSFRLDTTFGRLWRGDLIAARTHLEQSLRLSDTLQSSTTPLLGGQEPRVTALAWLVQPLWALGYADQARQRGQEALALARQVEHTPSLVYMEGGQG